MRLTGTYYQEDFPQQWSLFLEHIPADKILSCAHQVRSEIRGMRDLESILMSRYRTTFSLEAILAEMSSTGTLRTSPALHPDLYEAVGLVIQFSDLLSVLDQSHGKALGSRVRAGIRNPTDLRALMFELQVATLVSRLGFDISFPEMQSNGRSFDILATCDRRRLSIEFECKLITADKGRKIHQREAVVIRSHIHATLKQLARFTDRGLLIRITFPDSAPKDPRLSMDLAKDTSRAVVSGKRMIQCDYWRIEVVDFDSCAIGLVEGDIDTPAAEQKVSAFLSRYGIRNRETLVFKHRRGAPVIVTLESEKPDKVVDEIVKTVADSAAKQLTGTRPSVMCIKLDALTAAQLEGIGTEGETPTALRIATSRFLNSTDSRNVSALAFMADGVVGRSAQGAITRVGRTYHFENPRNEHLELLPTLFSTTP